MPDQFVTDPQFENHRLILSRQPSFEAGLTAAAVTVAAGAGDTTFTTLPPITSP